MEAENNQLHIPSYLNKGFFEKVLRKYLQQSDAHVENVAISMGCANGDNYCSIVYRVHLTFINNAVKEKSEKITWIVKSMPYEGEREVFADMLLYKKETNMYVDILSKLEACIQTRLAPRCHYFTRHPIDTIVFEDLTSLGLEQVSRDIGMDEEHCAIILEKLGQLHASSIYLVQQNPNIFDQMRDGMFSKEYMRVEQTREFFLNTFRTTLKFVEEWSGFEDIAKKMRAMECNYIDKTCENFDKTEGLWKVLNHGDLWTNNIFFKYATDGSRIPVECIFIDFQGCIYSSPGIDLIYFLNTSVQLDILQHKRNYIVKEYYYESLRTTLKKLHLHDIPTYDSIENEIRSREFFGLFTAIGSALICMDKDSSQDVKMESFVDKEMGDKFRNLACRTEKFEAKMKYLLRRADDLGLLD